MDAENQIPLVAGFALAGGQSSRMGTDKALIEFEGQLLIERSIGILKAAGIPVSIAGARNESRPRLESYAPVIPDRTPGLGPLSGICTGLRMTSAEYGVFLPVDVPLIPASLIVYLLWHARITGALVTVASVNGRPQTFPAVIARKTLPALDERLRGAERGCLAAFQAASAEGGGTISVLPAEKLVQSGQVAHPDALPAARWFLNINTARDLRLAGSLRKSRVS